MSIDLLPQILNEIKAINKSQQETKEFQDEMRGFQSEMREFQSEMREFQGEMIGFQGETKGFQSEMRGFQSEMRGFQGEMIGFQGETKGFQSEMRGFQGEMREFQGEVNTRLTSIEESQRRTEDKLDIVYDQTSNLTEVQTTLKQELNSLSKEVYFLSHKEVENEKEVITIKRHLELIK